MRDIDELRELRDYDAGAPPLGDAARERVRARLLAVAVAEDEPARVVIRRRPVLRIALTGVVAAAVAGGVLVAGQTGGGGRPAGASPSLGNVAAQTVLHGAAVYARQHEQAVAPRDDQFIYTKEIRKQTDRDTGATKTYVDENWRSVDGSKPSWVMEVGKGRWVQPLKGGQTAWPREDWEALEALPTDPEKLILALVPGGVPDAGSDPLGKLGKVQWFLVEDALTGMLRSEPMLPEGLRPAIYEALAMAPGVKVVPDQKDAKGRTGVGITYATPGHEPGKSGLGEFVFDPETYEYLGYRLDGSMAATGDASGSDDSGTWIDSTVDVPGPSVDQFTYLDSWAIVDKAKQRP
ncbi:CU044_5270 family protein [Streptomyces sp. NPDC021020]|uniref:CU044_5270 family protein n=1 Tax=Streptomyces sp. NPDC021020 TaxID=3365109 RepID=UPI00378EF3A2